MLNIMPRYLVGPVSLVSLLGAFSLAEASTISCLEAKSDEVRSSDTVACEVVVDLGLSTLGDDSTVFGGTWEDAESDTIGTIWDWYVETIGSDAVPVAEIPVVEPAPAPVEVISSPPPVEPVALVVLPEPEPVVGPPTVVVASGSGGQPPTPPVGSVIPPIGPVPNPPGLSNGGPGANLASVPEPVSLVLLSIGLIGVASMMRRRERLAARSGEPRS